MKSLLATLAFGMSLASGAYAQTLAEGKPVDPGAPHDTTGSAVSSAKFAEAMAHMPPEVADKVAAAREAAKAAKADIDKLKKQGKTPEEVQAAIAEKKAAAQVKLQNALNALNDLPESAKERTTKAKEVVSKRLEEREADAKNP